MPTHRTKSAAIAIAMLCAIATASRAADASPASRPPNVIIILADDLGYQDTGFQGGKDVRTPNLDSLAAAGVRCTDGHVSCPVCSPTRAGLLTGRYQQRFGHEHNPGGQPPDEVGFGLPLTETTLAQRLKGAGYHTGLVGKWHLGFSDAYVPTKRGFDEFFGFLGGAHKYLDLKADNRGPILRGTEPVEESEYLTDAFGREAVSFIDRHADAPFFLYLAFNAVHNPQEVTQKYLDRFPNVEDPRRRNYVAMLSALDDAVGGVLAKVKEKSLDENTLIFFLSDNGGPSPTPGQPRQGNGSNNGTLHGKKGQVYEGGVRVPFVVRWTGRLPQGATFDQPVISLDVAPTALAAAGATPSPGDKPFDGVDLLPFLKGDVTTPPHETLFWRFGLGNAAVRAGNWKLIKIADQPVELYDLAADLGETKNLAQANPAKVEELTGKLAAWEAELEKPRWSPNRQQARRANRRARAQ